MNSNPQEAVPSKPDGLFPQAYPFALKAARSQAWEAVIRGWAIPEDRKDLEQEGLLACWRALASFEPSRASLRTFMERVVAARLASVWRARRCRPSFQSLDRHEHDKNDTWAPNVELRSDVRRVLTSMETDDRRLVILLVDHTASEAGRALGIARSTVYFRLLRIRAAFRDAGLDPGDHRRTRRPQLDNKPGVAR